MINPLPTENATIYAEQIMQACDTYRCLDYESACEVSTDSLFGESRGLMFGVLVCKDRNGNTVVLKAFSGQYLGTYTIAGWVPPAFDLKAYELLVELSNKEIEQMNTDIDAATREGDEPSVQRLKEKRRNLSQRMQTEFFGLYRFHCSDGTVKNMTDIFGSHQPPTGTGDCCAPKLLNQAYEQNLVPVSMVEWFYGTTNKSEERKHKEYYPPCDQRCRPLLTAMLGLDIIYRDAEIVVVNKPSGLLSVPGRGPDKQDCVVNRLKRLFPLCIEQPSVHRLDMDTSGLLVLALTQKAHRNLSIQFIQRRVEKEYIALVDGVVTEESGTIELAFRYDPENKPRQKYDPVLGKVGITHWQKIRVESYGDGKRLVSRIRFVPTTGRTHQLRVHSMHEKGFGFPIVGDPLYGRAEGGRLMLHASKLAFTHPETSVRMEFFIEPEFA